MFFCLLCNQTEGLLLDVHGCLFLFLYVCGIEFCLFTGLAVGLLAMYNELCKHHCKESIVQFQVFQAGVIVCVVGLCVSRGGNCCGDGLGSHQLFLGLQACLFRLLLLLTFLLLFCAYALLVGYLSHQIVCCRIGRFLLTQPRVWYGLMVAVILENEESGVT